MVHDSQSDTIEFRPGRGVFQAADGGLRRQCGAAFGHFTGAHFEYGIIPERVGIVGVFVAAGNLINPLFKQLGQWVSDIALVTPVFEGSLERFDDTSLRLGFFQ